MRLVRQEPGAVGNLASPIFNNMAWAMMEISLAGSDRNDPTISLDFLDSAPTFPRELTMHLFTGDGSTSTPAVGAAVAANAFASATVATPDLGQAFADATTVSWSFPGVVLPDDLIMAIEFSDTDTFPTLLARVSSRIAPAAPTVGTNQGFNTSFNEGANWSLSTNSIAPAWVNVTIEAVPEASEALLVMAGMSSLILGARRRGKFA